MPNPPSFTARLRRAFRGLDELPDVISASRRPDATDGELPIEAATVDDVAFAAVGAHAKVSAAIRRSSTLQKLYRLASEAGGIGSQRAIEAALKRGTD